MERIKFKNGVGYMIVVGLLLAAGTGLAVFRTEAQEFATHLNSAAGTDETAGYAGAWVSVETVPYLIVSPPDGIGEALHDRHSHISKRVMSWGITIEDLGDNLLIAHTKGHVHDDDGDHAHDIDSIAFGVMSGEPGRPGIHFIIEAVIGGRGEPGSRPGRPELHLYPSGDELVGWFMGSQGVGQLRLQREEISAAP